MAAKRMFDALCSAFGLLCLSPLFLALALAIRFDSPGPVFFRQERVGLGGRTFRIFKFRTMFVDAEKRGLQITVGRDPRITRVGAFIRRSKLDEIPQLLNVLVGDMSLVGPRPEVPRYVKDYPADVRTEVLSVRPGITDLASIEFRDENSLLEGATDPDAVYRNEILPQKLRLCQKYIRERSFWGDVVIILRTLRVIAA